MRGSYDHPSFQSNAESALHVLYQNGYLRKELRKMPLTEVKIPLHPVHGVVDVGEYPRSELFLTRPDFYWQIGFYGIYQYLDGKHHLKKLHYHRDEHVTKLLEASGCIVLRHPFTRMTKGLLQAIYEETCAVVNGYCDKWDKMNGGRVY